MQHNVNCVEFGFIKQELCDNNSVACTSIDPDYYGGTAYCNSTCDGYNEDSCETDDGW